jgi:hypothetical protein
MVIIVKNKQFIIFINNIIYKNLVFFIFEFVIY